MIRAIFILCCFTLGISAQPSRIPAEDFARLPQLISAKLSPDGQYLSYISPIDGHDHIVVHPVRMTDQDKPILIPPIKQAEINWYRWANSERLLVSYAFTMKSAGRTWTETRLTGVNRDGSNFINLLEHNRSKLSTFGSAQRMGNIQDQVIHMLPDEPDHILIAMDEGANGASEVRKLNINTQNYRQEQGTRSSIHRWMADQSGTIRFGWGYDEKKIKAVYRGMDGKLRSAKKFDWYDKFELIAFDKNPAFAFAMGKKDGRDTIVRLNVDEGEVDAIIAQHNHVDMGGIIQDPITQNSIGYFYTEDTYKPVYFGGLMKRLQASLDKVLPNAVNIIIGRSADSEMILINSYSDRDPGRLFVYERSAKRLSIVAANRPWLDPEQMSPTQSIRYKARDGLDIPGYLTLPITGQAPYPTVVLPHGGPFGVRDEWGFDYLVQFFASRGYAVFQPNYRGSGGYGQAFQQAGHNQWGGTMQDDITDGVAWLVDNGHTDANRVCIAGISYGGYASLMGAVKTPDLFRCAIAVNAPGDLKRMVNDDKRTFVGGRVWSENVGLGEEKLQAASPLHRVGEITIPVLVIHAKDDARVPYKQGRKMAAKLKNVPGSGFVKLDDGGHSMVTEAARTTALKAMDRFLAEHLPVETQTSSTSVTTSTIDGPS